MTKSFSCHVTYVYISIAVSAQDDFFFSDPRDPLMELALALVEFVNMSAELAGWAWHWWHSHQLCKESDHVTSNPLAITF